MRTLATLLFALGLSTSVQAETQLHLTYLQVEEEQPPTLSNLEPRPEDLGLAGAQVAIADNNTTGRFLGQTYVLETVTVARGADPAAAARAALAHSPLLILDAPAHILLHIADLPQAQEALLFNIARRDTALRQGDCRANLLHTIPSQAMRADALMQFARTKRWDKLALISGEQPRDAGFATALERSAAKFGLEIGIRKTWTFDADMRRNAAQEVPLFTQGLGDHDLLLVADELGDFARYIPYNTWLPRPVAGSEGLTPTAWGPAVEQWGAAQLQSRFRDHAARPMRASDYAAWAAVRAVGEAVTRTKVSDVATLRAYLLSDQFQLAGFKGRPLSFRNWNGQLRQPIPLLTRGALAAQAPLPGYLHQHSELDTLGIDRPETTCEAFP